MGPVSCPAPPARPMSWYGRSLCPVTVRFALTGLLVPALSSQMEPIITKCSAQVGDEPCVTYVGEIGAGNYVKMVHNGIE